MVGTRLQGEDHEKRPSQAAIPRGTPGLGRQASRCVSCVTNATPSGPLAPRQRRKAYGAERRSGKGDE